MKSSTKKKILEALKENPSIEVYLLARKVGIQTESAYSYLGKLKQDGSIKRVRSYIITKKAEDFLGDYIESKVKLSFIRVDLTKEEKKELEISVLGYLIEEPTLSSFKLAKILGSTKHHISQSIKSLQEQGLILETRGYLKTVGRKGREVYNQYLEG